MFIFACLLLTPAVVCGEVYEWPTPFTTVAPSGGVVATAYKTGDISPLYEYADASEQKALLNVEVANKGRFAGAFSDPGEYMPLQQTACPRDSRSVIPTRDIHLSLIQSQPIAIRVTHVKGRRCQI